MSLELQTDAKIILDSINPSGNRVTTYLIRYPRFILSEINTHRVLSKNSSSSRAVPLDKMIEQVSNNPAIPVRWGINGKGMQDHGELIGTEAKEAEKDWRYAAEKAVQSALLLKARGLHKQISNRCLEPFVWMTTLISGTEWENFFSLRVHKDAQPEFQHLAHLMLKAYLSNTPQQKQWGEWHIPFGEQMPEGLDQATKIKVAVARAARTSYLTITNKIDIQRDIELHDNLVSAGHFSPTEHVCYADPKGSGNFKGWYQYRHTLPNENRKCDLHKLLKDYEDAKEVEHLKSQLSQLMPAETFDQWMSTPNSAFDNRTPNKVIEDGDKHLLEQMIYQIEAGVHN